MLKSKRFKDLMPGQKFKYLSREWIKCGTGWAECDRGQIQMRGHEIVQVEEPEAPEDPPAWPWPIGAWTALYAEWYGAGGDG